METEIGRAQGSRRRRQRRGEGQAAGAIAVLGPADDRRRQRRQLLVEKGRQLRFAGNRRQSRRAPLDLAGDFSPGKTGFGGERLLPRRAFPPQRVHGGEEIASPIDVRRRGIAHHLAVDPFEQRIAALGVGRDGAGHAGDAMAAHQPQRAEFDAETPPPVPLGRGIMLQRVILASPGDAVDPAVAAGAAHRRDRVDRAAEQRGGDRGSGSRRIR